MMKRDGRDTAVFIRYDQLRPPPWQLTIADLWGFRVAPPSWRAFPLIHGRCGCTVDLLLQKSSLQTSIRCWRHRRDLNIATLCLGAPLNLESGSIGRCANAFDPHLPRNNSICKVAQPNLSLPPPTYLIFLAHIPTMLYTPASDDSRFCTRTLMKLLQVQQKLLYGRPNSATEPWT